MCCSSLPFANMLAAFTVFFQLSDLLDIIRLPSDFIMSIQTHRSRQSKWITVRLPALNKRQSKTHSHFEIEISRLYGPVLCMVSTKGREEFGFSILVEHPINVAVRVSAVTQDGKRRISIPYRFPFLF